MLTLITRSMYYRDAQKKGLLLVDCGKDYMNPIKLTSTKGKKSLLAWIRKAKYSPVVNYNGNFFALWPEGKLKEVFGKKTQTTELLTVGEYLAVLNSTGSDHYSYSHYVYKEYDN